MYVYFKVVCSLQYCFVAECINLGNKVKGTENFIAIITTGLLLAIKPIVTCPIKNKYLPLHKPV